jgi:hypothetical protein
VLLSGNTSAAIQAAQTGAVTGGTNGIQSSGDMDSLTDRQDGSHLTDASASSTVSLMRGAIHSYGW